jgi:hypothetical protein
LIGFVYGGFGASCEEEEEEEEEAFFATVVVSDRVFILLALPLWDFCLWI